MVIRIKSEPSMIPRLAEKLIKKSLDSGKATILIGSRQVGKTTLLKKVLKGTQHIFINGDDPDDRASFSEINTEKLRRLIGKNQVVFVDEAQRIPNIGLTLKLITDQLKDVRLLVTGSSALEINDKTRETLTGRKREFNLYPISWEEYENFEGIRVAEKNLEDRLIFGMYPEVLYNPGQEYANLKELTTSFLYKDIFNISGIRKPEILERLVRALALQIGQEVSFNELSSLIGVDKLTIMRYVRILEQAFICFQLHSYSGNQRNEIKRGCKIYFWDNGIRNQIINNLNPVALRSDIGALWENFLVVERLKWQAIHEINATNYFWRTFQKQEIDFVSEGGGKVMAWEFKWNSKGKRSLPKNFLEAYKATGFIIDRKNFRSFVCPDSIP